MQIVTKFKELTLHTEFIFKNEKDLGYPGAKGPWTKLRGRKYCHASSEDGTVHTVGNQNVEVIYTPGKP